MGSHHWGARSLCNTVGARPLLHQQAVGVKCGSVIIDEVYEHLYLSGRHRSWRNYITIAQRCAKIKYITLADTKLNY